MGQLRKQTGGGTLKLAARLVVGRARSCELRLVDRSVSAEHASIFYERGHWRIRDLASRNGTRVNGVALDMKSRRVLDAGDVIRFGDDHESWELVDASPPPDDAVQETVNALLDIDEIGLAFHVSADEEDVRVEIESARGTLAAPPRSFWYLLLTLARVRLRDERARLTPEEQGWVYVEDLTPSLYSDTEALNVAVFRARKQLAELGVGGADRLIQRRPGSRRLRLGVARATIFRVGSDDAIRREVD